MPVRLLDPLDPLAALMAPPKDESPTDRWEREQREARARSISEQIDAQLKAEKIALKKRQKPIKVLLLGQSESGKSTTVKNFQLAYAYSSFVEERVAWRAVIHLNLIRSVTAILDILAQDSASRPPSRSHPSASRPSTASQPSSPFPVSPSLSVHAGPGDDADLGVDMDADSDDAVELAPLPALPVSDALRLLQLRLAPLRQVQRDLERSLGAGATEPAEPTAGGAAPWARRRGSEFAVASRSGWKTALRRVKAASAEPRMSIGSRDEARVETATIVEARRRSLSKFTGSKRSRPTSPGPFLQPVEDDDAEPLPRGESRVQNAAEIIASCAEDMAALWADQGVQDALARRSMRPEEGPGFFLNDVARITARDYEPSDDDVVRARLRTTGVQEFRFIFERGAETGREWLIYDVGGARSSRNAWYPYFDDINAIIFLAPISCFDERLAEDTRVNRVEDSLLLWKAVCASKLLSKVQLILFLNKCDLLHAKLERGVRVVDYVRTYGGRPNDARAVAKYFRQQFKDTMARHSPADRGFYSFLTSVVDTKATAKTVATVREGIQRNYLIEAEVI